MTDTLKNAVNFFTGNLILNLSLIAWALAQIIKFFVNLVVAGERDWRYLLTGGGMPSSHSSTVCACASAVAYLYGWSDPLFAIAAVVAVVVMYDASHVRRSAGEQARILNYMMRSWDKTQSDELGDVTLKELIGHTPLQVLMGAALGVAIGWGGSWLWLNR